ncbi:branched-chain amino acid ABC transporter permease [Microvirga puerhi]|uniref:Branched-chain amino acid ABC transporter permease n=1 Tax=Microvirga puerhi TaxID=2876078 RepID=A0ABS7VT28_9HYPH|nr:branched-chain amino acid ABC transporter permease [Microvirga puerhi]MBZ6078723.1 branched-chain amino acid ABC transporter permease [Microvirga puerhi]
MLRLITLALVGAVLIAAPLFLEPHSIGVLTTALIAALFAMAFNLLSGRAGMLSFGHAAYFAIGGFAVIHTMQAVESGAIWLPTPLVPLMGGVAGLIGGLGAGFFATRRSGVYFSMVTLALAEMLHALAPNLGGFFGGEVGLTSMRMPWLAFDYGSENQVYFTVLAWTVFGIALLYAYNQTLFGRLTVGLRESERRISFLGYNAHHTKIIVFGVSAMFSGIAGGLLAFATESMNYSMLGMGMSASVVLHTFVGGSTVFLGPALGALIFALFGSLVSDLTKNWLLYQGILFVLIMMFMGDGLAMLWIRIVNECRSRNWDALRQRVLLLIPGLLITVGAITILEVTSKILDQQQYATSVARMNAWPPVSVFGVSWDPTSALTWLLPLVAILVGIGFVYLILARKMQQRTGTIIMSREPAR